MKPRNSNKTLALHVKNVTDVMRKSTDSTHGYCNFIAPQDNIRFSHKLILLK